MRVPAAPTAPISVFLSYRREETAAQAGRLHDLLVARLGEDHVFMDVSSIGLGTDFVEAIERAVASCDALLAVIGDRWLGGGRLDDPADYVRLEVQAALERGIPVVPVLINGAPLPHATQLPAPLASLARRQALELTDATFRHDAERLLDQLAPAGAPPRRSHGGWSASVVDRSVDRRVIRVELTHDVHLVRFFSGTVWDSIQVDGSTVVRKLSIQGHHRFTVTDGAAELPAICSVKKNYAAGNGLRRISIEVDRVLLYEGD